MIKIPKSKSLKSPGILIHTNSHTAIYWKIIRYILAKTTFAGKIYSVCFFRLGMIHIWRPWKFSQFSRPPKPLVHLSPPSWPWTSNFKRTLPPPPLQMKTNRLKENILQQGWLLHVIRSFLQIDFRFQHQLINLVWLYFDFFSFSWSLTICFFVAL